MVSEVRFVAIGTPQIVALGVVVEGDDEVVNSPAALVSRPPATPPTARPARSTYRAGPCRARRPPTWVGLAVLPPRPLDLRRAMVVAKG